MVIEFIRKLQRRYQILCQTVPAESSQFQYCARNLKTLVIAEVALSKKQQIAAGADLPLNLVVFGPTQAGKSTLVNCLLPEPLAGISPLAGYTVNPQGFVFGLSSTDWLERLLPDLQRYQPDQLREREKANPGHALRRLSSSPTLKIGKPLVIWDTPDFDSIDAKGYMDGVLRTIALADILVLIVSKEKYADQSVWAMLEMLAPLELPLLVCINKVEQGEEQTLGQSFLNHYRKQMPDTRPPSLVFLQYMENGELPDARPVIDSLMNLINTSFRHSGDIEAFIKVNWQEWIQPVQEEIKRDRVWQERLETAIDEAMETYQREFLEHPDLYDTFQRTLAELLQLLEIPLLAGSIGKVRAAVTWPMRKLYSMGKNVLYGEKQGREDHDLGYERILLRQLSDQIITQLAKELISEEDCTTSFTERWEASFRRSLVQSRQVISDTFEQQIDRYQKEFQEEIQDAARQLYSRLEAQPSLLNSLRATRVTTDAAALVLALKTGGLSLNDFILAPAMLSLSSMLASSSVGQYVNTVKAKLKKRQHEKVRHLFEDHIAKELEQLRLKAEKKEGWCITEQEIREVESELFDQ